MQGKSKLLLVNQTIKSLEEEFEAIAGLKEESRKKV